MCTAVRCCGTTGSNAQRPHVHMTCGSGLWWIRWGEIQAGKQGSWWEQKIGGCVNLITRLLPHGSAQPTTLLSKWRNLFKETSLCLWGASRVGVLMWYALPQTWYFLPQNLWRQVHSQKKVIDFGLFQNSRLRLPNLYFIMWPIWKQFLFVFK